MAHAVCLLYSTINIVLLWLRTEKLFLLRQTKGSNSSKTDEIIINLYIHYQIMVICLQCKFHESKKGGNDQESIQSCTTSDPGYHMRK